MELYRKDVHIDNVDEIEEAFKSDYGYDLFEQNTTDYQTEGSCVIKVQAKFYKVTVEVTMLGAWQDVGDKLYTIDSFDRVTYSEVEYDTLVHNFNSRINNIINSKMKEIDELKSQFIKEGK